MDNIEIIYDELKRNQIHIDQRTLAFHINTILDQNKDMYSQIHVSDFEQLYRGINITNFGRIIAYLAYVFKQHVCLCLLALTFVCNCTYLLKCSFLAIKLVTSC